MSIPSPHRVAETGTKKKPPNADSSRPIVGYCQSPHSRTANRRCDVVFFYSVENARDDVFEWGAFEEWHRVCPQGATTFMTVSVQCAPISNALGGIFSGGRLTHLLPPFTETSKEHRKHLSKLGFRRSARMRLVVCRCRVTGFSVSGRTCKLLVCWDITDGYLWEVVRQKSPARVPGRRGEKGTTVYCLVITATKSSTGHGATAGKGGRVPMLVR